MPPAIHHRIEKTWSQLLEKKAMSCFGASEIDLKPYIENFTSAMNDDFNSPRALAVVFDLIKEYNRLIGENSELTPKNLDAMVAFFSELPGSVLGLKINADTGLK